MAHHGIQVFLKQDHRIIEEFKNPFLKRHEDFEGYFRSCLVSMAPEECEVIVKFTQDFRQFSEDGVFINIASEDITQSFWIDYRTCLLTRDHTFHSFLVWDSDGGDNAARCISVPAPHTQTLTELATADWMVSDEFRADKGCISVWIQRGKLADSRDDGSESYERNRTDPPTLQRYDILEGASIIRPEWFRHLKSENGQPYLFEIRNVDLKHVDTTTMRPEDEIDPAFDEDFIDDESYDSDSEAIRPSSNVGSDSGRSSLDDNTVLSRNMSTRKRMASPSNINFGSKVQRLDDVQAGKYLALKIDKRALRKVGRSSSRDPNKKDAVSREALTEQKDNKSSPVFSEESAPFRPTSRKTVPKPRNGYTDLRAEPELHTTGNTSIEQQKIINCEVKGVSRTMQTPVQVLQGPSAVPEQDTSDQDAKGEDIEDLEDQLEIIKLRRAIRAAKKKKAGSS